MAIGHGSIIIRTYIKGPCGHDMFKKQNKKLTCCFSKLRIYQVDSTYQLPKKHFFVDFMITITTSSRFLWFLKF